MAPPDSSAPGPGDPGAAPPSHPVDRIEIRLPSRADFLGSIRTVVRGVLEECLQLQVPEKDVHEVQIALQEACINVVRHAHGGDASIPLVVGITARPDRIVLEIEDWGPGLPDPGAFPPDPDPDRPREGGYGLFIMRNTMDEFRSERRDGRHVLVLVKHLGSPEPPDPPAPGGRPGGA